MEELFNLTYKDEVEALREFSDFEARGDAKYLDHPNAEARLYWAFCRPSGSCAAQISDSDPLVSIMAFNHSRLGALKRFELLHPQVIADESLRIKINNRSRMLFRSLADNDLSELNLVLDLVPMYLQMALDQLKNGRKWNEIPADLKEATQFLKRAEEYVDEALLEALYAKQKDLSEAELSEVKEYLEELLSICKELDLRLLENIQKELFAWVKRSDLHILQKKTLQKQIEKLKES